MKKPLIAAVLFMAASLCAAADLRLDLAYVRETLSRVHPGLAFSADVAQLEQAMSALEHDAGDVTADEAWRRLSTLNSLLADAHTFIGPADWRAETQAHLAQGGGLFPFELDLDGGKPLIRFRLGGAASELAGAEITRINGVPIRAQLPGLLTRMHGDTPLFRRHLLGQRWWLYHWKLHGAAASYDLEYRLRGKARKARFAASTALPLTLREEASFDNTYQLSLLPNKAALLKVGSFQSDHKTRFMKFTAEAFRRLEEAQVDTLLIDISGNGGGDDDMWLDGLMPYLADKPFRTGSTYRKKLADTGKVEDGELTTWHQPPTSRRWQGKTYVLIGPSTYSSAILFANTVQDFGFATLAGVGGAARSTQTGGVRKFVLPQSGLALFVPRFILDRPAGSAGAQMVQPDIPLPVTQDAASTLLKGLHASP